MKELPSDAFCNLPKVKFHLTLVTEDIKNIRMVLVVNTNIMPIHLHDVHLQRLGLKALLVAATRASQSHCLLTLLGYTALHWTLNK